MLVNLRLCLAFGCALACATAGASDVRAALINFDAIARSQPITSQFAVLGVTFSGGLYCNPFPETSIQGNREGTNFLNGNSIRNPIVASFSPPAASLEFLVAGPVTGLHTILVRAFSGPTTIAELDLNTGTTSRPGGNLPSVTAAISFLGGFDRVEISRTDGNLAFAFDDFRFTLVPECSSWALSGIGVLGLLACVQRVSRCEPEAGRRPQR
jgi:hypothetical protein